MSSGDFSDPWVNVLRRQQRKFIMVTGGSYES